MTFVISHYFYLFLTPLVILCGSICFQFISLGACIQVHSYDHSDVRYEQRKFFFKWLIFLCLLYCSMEFFIMEMLLRRDTFLLLTSGLIWLPQIYTNATRVHRDSVHLSYVLGV